MAYSRFGTRVRIVFAGRPNVADGVQLLFEHGINAGAAVVGWGARRILTQGMARLYDYYYNHFGLGQATGLN